MKKEKLYLCKLIFKIKHFIYTINKVYFKHLLYIHLSIKITFKMSLITLVKTNNFASKVHTYASLLKPHSKSHAGYFSVQYTNQVLQRAAQLFQLYKANFLWFWSEQHFWYCYLQNIFIFMYECELK